MYFANKIKDNVWWWLGRKRPFIINDEYKLELLFIDKINNSAKIRITKLRDNEQRAVNVSSQENEDGKY